ncbi:MAG TPA: prolipoprotein diacylglyceryl transferase family protein, partial [Candidatus Obscuribacterales bacterium]
ACDLLGSSMPLAQSIGRWGNFFNSEAFGKPVSESFPLRLYIPPENRPSTFSTADFFHPTFLYESVWDLLLFVICYFALADRLRNYPGVTFCLYIGGYSIGRLLIEPLRTDSLMAFGIPAPMLASALMLGIAMVGLLVLLKHHWSNAQKQAD